MSDHPCSDEYWEDFFEDIFDDNDNEGECN